MVLLALACAAVLISTAALADFLQHRLMTIKGVVRTRAQVSLSAKKESTLLPLPIPAEEKK